METPSIPRSDEVDKVDSMGKPAETKIQLFEEHLEVSKQQVVDEALIIKEPFTELHTIEVPVSFDKLIIEKRMSTGVAKERALAEDRRVLSVSLTREQVTVDNVPYVKEEVAVFKKRVSETRTITETVTSERLKTENTGGPISMASESK